MVFPKLAEKLCLPDCLLARIVPVEIDPPVISGRDQFVHEAERVEARSLIRLGGTLEVGPARA